MLLFVWLLFSKHVAQISYRPKPNESNSARHLAASAGCGDNQNRNAVERYILQLLWTQVDVLNVPDYENAGRFPSLVSAGWVENAFQKQSPSETFCRNRLRRNFQSAFWASITGKAFPEQVCQNTFPGTCLPEIVSQEAFPGCFPTHVLGKRLFGESCFRTTFSGTGFPSKLSRSCCKERFPETVVIASFVRTTFFQKTLAGRRVRETAVLNLKVGH